MADLARTVSILFQGGGDLEKYMSGLSGSVAGFSDGVEAAAAPFAKVTDSVLALDAAVLALVAGGIGLAIKKGGEFGDQFGEIATLVDLPRKSLEKFEREIIDYSRSSSRAITDINAAIYTAISAGTDYNHSLELLAQTEKLSIAGLADLNDTTRLIASSLNAYGAEVSEAGRYSDVFFTTVKYGQTTIPELAQNLSKVTGIAAAGGVPIETLTAAIAALTATGQPTSEAITSIKAALSNIIKPGEKAIQTAADLKIGFDAAALKGKGFDGVLADIYEKTGGNVEQMGKLFKSTEALNAALVLSSDTSGKFAGSLAAMATAAGATSVAWGKVKDDFTNINQQIANNVNATLITVGLKLQDEYSAVGVGILNVLKAIGDELDAGTFDDLIGLVESFGSDLASLLEGIAKAIPGAFDLIDFSGLLDSLGDMGDGLGELFDNLDLSDSKDLAAAIQGVVDSVESLVRITTGIGQSFKPFIEAIKEGINQVNNLDAADKEAFGNLLGAAKLITVAGAEIVLALGLIESSGVNLGRVFDVAFGGVRLSINALQTAFDSLVLGIGKGLEFLLENANRVSFGKIAGLAEAVESVKEFNAAVEAHRNEQVAGMSQGWDQLAGNVKKTGDEMAAIPAEVVSTIKANAEIDPEIQYLLDNPDSLAAEISVSVDDQAALVAQDKISKVGGAAAYNKVDGVWTNTVDISPVVNQESAVQAKDKLDRDFAKQELALETNLNIEKIKADSAIAQDFLKFKASVDIAQIESGAKIIESLASGIEAAFSSTGEVLSGLFGGILDVDAGSQKYNFIAGLIKDESKLRERSLVLAEELNAAQIEYMAARTDALNAGDSLIQIDGSGLAPELEAFMFKILERIQIRATAELSEFLIGVGA